MRKYILLFAILPLPIFVTAAEKLNVKTGLWEITSLTEMQGMPPVPKEVLEKMSPEQRTRIENMFKGQGGEKSKMDTRQECVTQEDLEKAFTSDTRENCKSTITKSTRTAQEAQVVCTGQYKGSGTLKISTPTPETMSGDFEIKMGEGQNGMLVKTQLTGKWLGASCPNESKE